MIKNENYDSDKDNSNNKSIISDENEKNRIQDIFTDLTIYQSNSNSLIKLVSDIIKVEDNINIIDFQAFYNHIAILEESDKKRQS